MTYLVIARCLLQSVVLIGHSKLLLFDVSLFIMILTFGAARVSPRLLPIPDSSLLLHYSVLSDIIDFLAHSELDSTVSLLHSWCRFCPSTTSPSSLCCGLAVVAHLRV